jgi:pimeloyl-ACP methyl ester carboxylesterase
MQPFNVNISQPALDDLANRLPSTRWPDEIVDSGWMYGSNLGYLRDLVEYWRSEFDWRAREASINRWPQFVAEVDGLKIHFIHQRGKGPAPAPLLITHGWPSSFAEMLDILPLLTDPAAHGGHARDAFDVIVPSLPGCGFSDRPNRAGMSKHRIAHLWAKLMTQLGYETFFAHAGDIGAGVTSRLALEYPKRLRAIHVLSAIPPYLGPGSRELTQAERAFVAYEHKWLADEGGYIAIQSTRPQTLAYGLNDSPVGLAAWIVEKFRAWSDCAGEVERRFTKDQLLTNIAIYWFTQTAGSSMRLYYENRVEPNGLKRGERIDVPSAVALTVEPIDRCPREWAERSYNLQQFTQFPRGGHFMALEEPQLLVHDLRQFFGRFR